MAVALLLTVPTVAAAAKLLTSARADRARPAVPGGTRRDHFGDRLAAPSPASQSSSQG